MLHQNQFYHFYRPYIEKICQNIKRGKSSILVGINSAGKTLLTLQLKSDRFKNDYQKKLNIKLVFLEFKDKPPPGPSQLYRYWLKEGAKILNYHLPAEEAFNDFSFYFHLNAMAHKLKEHEKLSFIILDAQNILNQGETFWRTLIYLNRYTYGKVTFHLLSEPQILYSQNLWVIRFIEDLINSKFIFLKLFDKKTISADIEREEEFLKVKLPQIQRSIVLNYCGGLHGVIGALCYFFKKNPGITSIKQLKRIVEKDQMFRYWIEDILKSLPPESISILQVILSDDKNYALHSRRIFWTQLIRLGFIRKNGKFLHPLMESIINSYRHSKILEYPDKLEFKKNVFVYANLEIDMAKKEKSVMQLLYKNRGQLVTYDRIGEAIWPDNPDKFSLWAIAQIVRRLRKKLVFHTRDNQIISSRRGKGYILN